MGRSPYSHVKKKKKVAKLKLYFFIKILKRKSPLQMREYGRTRILVFQWALDILEPPGGEIKSLVSRVMLPSSGAFLGFIGVMTFNFQRKIPVKSNLAAYVLLTGLGGFGGEKMHAIYRQKKADQIAAAKHYIMLHPERFPEPEKMKLGDKRVFYRWNPLRWGPTGVDY